MTDYIVSDTDLTAVANKIRSKGGTSAQLEFPAGFISAIDAISGGGGGSAVVQALSVTENGTYTPPSGVDGYAPVTVNVSGAAQNLFEDYFEQGTFTATGLNANATDRIRSHGFTMVEPGSWYLLAFKDTNSSASNWTSCSASFYADDDYETERESYIDWTKSTSAFFQIPDTCRYVRFLVRSSAGGSFSPNRISDVTLLKLESQE